MLTIVVRGTWIKYPFRDACRHPSFPPPSLHPPPVCGFVLLSPLPLISPSSLSIAKSGLSAAIWPQRFKFRSEQGRKNSLLYDQVSVLAQHLIMLFAYSLQGAQVAVEGLAFHVGSR